jgi:glycerol kinase
MSAEAILAIDQGTTATKVARLEPDGSFAVVATHAHRQIVPRAGWAEHDPEELVGVLEAALANAGPVAAFGLANQGETVLAWEAGSGRPLCNAIVWHDQRTRDDVETLRAAGAEREVLERAGLPLDCYFSASKMAWILRHVDEARPLLKAGRLRLGTSDVFFRDRLTGRYATDATTASRTSLMNLRTRRWDERLCALFGVPVDALPAIEPSAGMLGDARGVRLTASIVDQQAALIGHGCVVPGAAKITFGTGAFALACVGSDVPSSDAGLFGTVAWATRDAAAYALEGGVFSAGAAVDWARRLGLFADHGEIDSFAGPSALERGLVFVPALSGLGAPFFDRSAAGLFIGMDGETTRLQLAQAVLEGIALRAAQIARAMARDIALAGPVSIDGGLSRNRYFCDFLSRALGLPIAVPEVADLTALGVAHLAAFGAGLSLDLASVQKPRRRVRDAAARRLPAALLARFDDATTRARGWR